MFLDYFFLAFNNLKQRGLRSWLTLLGIIIGIAAVVSFISLGNSLEQAITGQFASLSTDRLVVANAETGFGPPGSTVVKKLNRHDKEIIEEVHGVSSVIARLIRSVKVEYNKIAIFTFIGSLPNEQEHIDFIYKTFQLKPASGRLINSNDRGLVLLGSNYKNEKIFKKDIRPGSVIKIQGKQFEVAGILEPLGAIQFNNAIFMAEEDMRKLLSIEDENDLFIVQAEDKKKTEEVAESIKRKLMKDRGLKNGEEDFSVETPIEIISTVSTILAIINLVVIGIAAISLLIGAIGVANTMFTSNLERTKEIGIMKSIGAENKNISSIFLLESVIFGFIGGILGTTFGLLMAFAASKAANSALGAVIFTINLNIPLIIGAIIFSLILGISTGAIPAWQASRLHPVEALRK